MYKRQGLWENITDAYSSPFHDYFTKIAITLDGKAYVLAVAENNKNMQMLFVTKIVNKASEMLKTLGPQHAFSAFSKPGSAFKHNNESYVFVYSEDGVCLYNPNYKNLVGKKVAETDTPEAKYIKEMIKIAKNQSEGWFKVKAHVPGEKGLTDKDIYFKSIFVNGKTYIVGSGAYIKQNTENQ